MSFQRLVTVLAVACAALAAAPVAGAQLAVAVVPGPYLGVFDTDTPGFSSYVPLTGLQFGERMAAIDVRPLDGVVYGIGVTAGATDTARLYRIDAATGVATAVGAPFTTTAPVATFYGADFNPVADRMRVVSTAGESDRVNPLTGILAGHDVNINPGTPQIDALAYDRSTGSPAPAATTLFSVARFDNTLGMLGGVNGAPSPNGGSVTEIGPIGTTISSASEQNMDIAADGRAYLTFRAAGDGLQKVARVDLFGGAATVVRSGGEELEGFALLPATAVSLGPAVTAAEAQGAATVTVTRTGADIPLDVAYATAPGSAGADVDYVSVAGALHFPTGVTTRTITVPLRGDLALEPLETFRVTLAAATPGVGIGTASATVQIADSSTPPPPPVAPTVVLIGFKPVTLAALVKGIGVPFACASSCVAALDLRFNKKLAGSTRRLLTGAQAVTVKLKLSAAGKKLVTAAFGKKKTSVKVSFEGAFANDGKVTLIKRTITVKRK